MRANIPYNDLLKLPQWAAKREEILSRDGFCCVNCRSSESLQVHHRQYHVLERVGEFVKPWAYPNRYLITLCESCHKAGHKIYTVPVFNL